MSDTTTLGFVAAGKRARSLMEDLYTIREQEYFLADRADGWPEAIYDTFAEETPQWVDDVSNLHPEITAVMNPGEDNRTTAHALCRDYGDDPKLFATLEEFLEVGDYDAVIVASPNHLHVDAVLPLLDRDVTVFCEKPLATTLEAHDRMIEAERNSDAPLYVGFQRRVAPYYRKMKSLLDGGTIGELGMMNHIEVRDPFQTAGPASKGYRFDQERTGGALLEKNSHDFDLFNWYSGSDPLGVTAFGGQHVLEKNTDIVDQAVVNVEYEGGVVASLELCLYNGVGVEDVYGVRTRKTSEYRGSGGVLRAPEPGTIEVATKDERDQITTGAGGSHGGDIVEMKQFLRFLQGDAAPPATALDAKKAAAVAIGAERSIADGGTLVEIDGEYDLVG